MTIPRRPLTFERALARIADLIGWDGCAQVLEKSESLLRKLGAPDTERAISMRDAVRLDAAWRRAGGEGAPLLECYALQLEVEPPVLTTSHEDMMATAAIVAKESGEAVSAALDASLSGCPVKRQRALVETEEAIAAGHQLITRLKGCR